MDADTQSQIEHLEGHIAHLEKHYDELNEVVISQGKELARLRLQVQRLTSTIEGIELDRAKATNAKPPHATI